MKIKAKSATMTAQEQTERVNGLFQVLQLSQI